MPDRRNIKLSADVYERLADAKGSKDTWDEFLSRRFNSAEDGQVHLDRQTLDSFSDEPTAALRIRASDEGEVELVILDDSGTQIGATSLGTLDPGSEVSVVVQSGDPVD